MCLKTYYEMSNNKIKENEIYSSYGRFAIKFENLCEELRFCILFHLEKYGLKQQSLTHLMISDLTAYQLISKNRGIIAFVYKDNQEIINHLDPFFKALLNLNEKRNFIIHGNWNIKQDYDTEGNRIDNSEMMEGSKRKIIKDGVRYENVIYGQDEFNELSEKLITAIKITRFLYGIRDIEDINRIGGDTKKIEHSKNWTFMKIITKEEIDTLK